MTPLDIAHQRLHNQHLVGAPLPTPEAVVGWLGAAQAQDYAGAKWAIAQRAAGATNAALDQVFDDGRILRTHLMRPTWHFVLPADIRWLLQLTAPRVHAANAYMYRRLELDDTVFGRAHAALANALRGGAQLTRPEIARVYSQAGVEASGLRLGYLLMRAELDALICSGAPRGKQFTYAWLDDRVPPTPPLDHDAALAELTRRYFRGHGPALAQDFAWWSGLTIAEARTGIELARPHLAQAAVDGKTYWFAEPLATTPVAHPTIHLLPNYDEYLIAYRDHSASFDPRLFENLPPTPSQLLAHIVVRDGHVIGGWRRAIAKRAIAITTDLLARLDLAEHAALAAAAADYGRFMALPVTLA